MTSERAPPIFLTLDEVLAIHADQIERDGGALGIRDRGLLEFQPYRGLNAHRSHRCIFPCNEGREMDHKGFATTLLSLDVDRGRVTCVRAPVRPRTHGDLPKEVR